MVLARYRNRLMREALSLQPHGEAWSRDVRSNFARLWYALGFGLARAEERGANVIDEADPRTTAELLSEWEAALGLPDNCLPVPETEAQRRALITARSVGVISASPEYFVLLAESIGVAITVVEGSSTPSRVNETSIGDSLEDEQGDFVWTVFAPQTQRTLARVDEARIGDSLETYGNELLECVLRQVTPAHTYIRFAYDDGASALYVTNADGSRTRIPADQDGINVQTDEGSLRIPIADGAVTIKTDSGDLDVDLEQS